MERDESHESASNAIPHSHAPEIFLIQANIFKMRHFNGAFVGVSLCAAHLQTCAIFVFFFETSRDVENDMKDISSILGSEI